MPQRSNRQVPWSSAQSIHGVAYSFRVDDVGPPSDRALSLLSHAAGLNLSPRGLVRKSCRMGHDGTPRSTKIQSYSLESGSVLVFAFSKG